MPNFEVTVERLNPRDHMIVDATTEAVAVESAIQQFGGITAVKFVSVTEVPSETLDQVLARLQAQADADEAARQASKPLLDAENDPAGGGA